MFDTHEHDKYGLCNEEKCCSWGQLCILKFCRGHCLQLHVGIEGHCPPSSPPGFKFGTRPTDNHKKVVTMATEISDKAPEYGAMTPYTTPPELIL